MIKFEQTSGHGFNGKAVKKFLNGLGRVLFHVLLVALSASIAFSLPYMVSVVARNFWIYWSIIEREQVYLITVEIVTAIILLLIFSYFSQSLKDRRIAQIARYGGLRQCFRGSRLLARGRIKRLKNKQGFARDVLLISSTGFRTFADPKGDLHQVLRNCREAKIMLLNPRSEGAALRAKSILAPSVTAEQFAEQIKVSIGFLKALSSTRNNIRLKLYADAPFLKLAVLGDYIWLKHYHPGLDVQTMPEYVIEHGQNIGGLYTPLYQYFLMRWENPDMPEYDLATDELIFRDASGKQTKRERFELAPQANGWEQGHEIHSASSSVRFLS